MLEGNVSVLDLWTRDPPEVAPVGRVAHISCQLISQSGILGYCCTKHSGVQYK